MLLLISENVSIALLFIRILLNYYDKQYEKGLNNRENLPALLTKITCTTGDVKINTKKLTDEKQLH